MGRRGRPKSLVMILARDLASRLSTPAFLVDAEGTLVFFNEAAEGVLGKPFAEAGEMTAAEWTSTFATLGPDDQPVPMDRVTLYMALREQRHIHEALRFAAADGEVRRVSVTAIPLFAHEGLLEGALALFWEEPEAT